MYSNQARRQMMDIWVGMLGRCNKPAHISFPRYGGRGIKVCQRWADSFEAFCADIGERPQGMSLDRWPNNDGNYEPGNVRWATAKEQANGRSTAKLLTIDGITDSWSGWAARRGAAFRFRRYRTA